MNDADLERNITHYVNHLTGLCDVFNEAAEARSINVRMDATKAIAAIDVNLGEIAPFWSRIDDTGVVHEAQLRTAVDCIEKLVRAPQRCGHVLGAMQSGKTTTSLTLQWAGPVLYLLTGSKHYPFYIISSQTSHEDQTIAELERFSAYYGNLEFRRVDGQPVEGIDAMFARSSTLNTYRKYVLRDEMEYVQPVAPLDDLVHRRVQGHKGVEQIVRLCHRANAQGYQPLMIIDEPQFGASDRIVKTDDGVARRTCLLQQIFVDIEASLGTDWTDHRFVGLSATPFELNDLSEVWEVRQYLSSGYSGFNAFNGAAIDPSIQITPPETIGLTRYAEAVDEPFLADVSMAAYDGSQSVFDRHAGKIGFEGDQDAYQEAVVATLRSALTATLADYEAAEPGRVVGLCVRAFNDNARTEALIMRLGLDPERVEVIRYYGARANSLSIKKMIARRGRPDLPYVIFVTNRARMADAFPAEVRFFLDLAQKAQDLNALLQGLLGRACGYGKRSRVVLSDFNAQVVEAYTDTLGGYVLKPSRHSIAVSGGLRRGAPTGMIKLTRDMADHTVRDFFEQIDARVVEPNLKPGLRLSPTRASRASGDPGFRTAPILRIADQVGLFDHIERPDVRQTLFPRIRTNFQVARADDVIQHTRHRGVPLRYQLDDAGDCRFTFRWSQRDAAAQGGAAGRAKGSRDKGQHMEPTIYVEKFDPLTGEIIPKAEEREGAWRAFMVTFPLRQLVQEFEVATIALPTDTSAFDSWLSDDERDQRAEEMWIRRRGRQPA